MAPRPFRPGMPVPRYSSQLPSKLGPAAQQRAAMGLPAGAAPTIQQMGGTVEINPWYVFEFPSSQDWSAVALNFVAAASSTTIVPGFSYTVPPNRQGVIKQLQLTVQNSLATIDLRVTLLKNGGPIQGWKGIAFPPVSATGIVLPYNGMVVRLVQGDVLTAQFVEASGTSYTCSIQAQGWDTASAEIERLQNGISV